MQSSRLTALEVLTNTLTGLVGSWCITLYFVGGNHTPIETASIITIACTVWSLLRGYVIRRLFNRLSMKVYRKNHIEKT